MWILVRKESLELLLELLRKKTGNNDDQLLEELLASTMIPRKPIEREKGNGRSIKYKRS